MAVHLRLARTGRHKRPMYRGYCGRFTETAGAFGDSRDFRSAQEPGGAGVEVGTGAVMVAAWRPAQHVTVRTLLKRHGVWKEFETEKSAKAEKTEKTEKSAKSKK